MTVFALKIDVDTERGTAVGVSNLLSLFQELAIPATFLFSLGPDNTGRALKRLFRPGFLKKALRSNVVNMYGFKTLLNGVLWPGPFIAKRHADIMRRTKAEGHEVGIHCYDHIRWQDNVHKMTREAVFNEFKKACDVFETVFGTPALSAGAAGWQANANSLAAYDEANLLYGSDGRGACPFYPKINDHIFKTIQIPTTLPTLDELLGRPEYPEESLIKHYSQLLTSDLPNIFTMHAEIEGMAKLKWFREFLKALQKQGVIFKRLDHIAQELLKTPHTIMTSEFLQGQIDGRSGSLAVQG